MERISAGRNAITRALHHLIIRAPYPKRVSPPWDEVIGRIALERFPKTGLILRPTLLSLAARRMILEYDRGYVHHKDVGLAYPGRPNFVLLVYKSYGTDRDADSRYRPGSPLLRETYKMLFVNPEDIEAHPTNFPNYGQGIVLFGSPGELYPRFQFRSPDGLTSVQKKYPDNCIPNDASDEEKIITIRVLRRIGFWD